LYDALGITVNFEFGKIAMKKRVYITWFHHHVIKEWFRYREYGMHLLSFDYHTDFCEAFVGKFAGPSKYSRELHNSYLRKHIPCNDVESAIRDLRNDEHIDFAIRSRMVDKAFIFSRNTNTFHDARVLSIPSVRKQVVRAGIFSCCEVDHPLAAPQPYNDITEARMARLIASDEVLHKVIKTFGEYGFNQDNYILDFDCDFIRDREAMMHGKFQTLKELIRGAKAITIAREPGCVCECSGETLSYEEIETWLVGLIQDCVDGVEIERET